MIKIFASPLLPAGLWKLMVSIGHGFLLSDKETEGVCDGPMISTLGQSRQSHRSAMRSMIGLETGYGNDF